MTTLRKSKMFSRGHGVMERFVLDVLKESGDLAAWHLARRYPNQPRPGRNYKLRERSFMNSLNRAIRNLARQKKIAHGAMLGDAVTWRIVDHDELESTAYHEAGHAVLRRVQKLPVNYVSIIPEKGMVGHVHIGVSRKYSDMGKRRIEKEIIDSMAGSIAQRKHVDEMHGRGSLYSARVAPGASADNLGIRTGLSYLVYGRWSLYVDDDYKQRRAQLKTKARQLVDKYWPAIMTVAAALLEFKKFDGNSIDKLIAAIDSKLNPFG